jgi:hypothetical protein
MSAEGSFWVGMAEKLFGIITIIIGILLIYFTLTSTDTLGGFSGLFSFLAIVMIIAGVLLLLAKPPE